MTLFQKVGEVIETGANLLSYGKAESDIRSQLLALEWSEAQVTQLLRGMRWRMKTEADG